MGVGRSISFSISCSCDLLMNCSYATRQSDDWEGLDLTAAAAAAAARGRPSSSSTTENWAFARDTSWPFRLGNSPRPLPQLDSRNVVNRLFDSIV